MFKKEKKEPEITYPDIKTCDEINQLCTDA